jgi:hypothetical protein
MLSILSYHWDYVYRRDSLDKERRGEREEGRGEREAKVSQ